MKNPQKGFLAFKKIKNLIKFKNEKKPPTIAKNEKCDIIGVSKEKFVQKQKNLLIQMSFGEVTTEKNGKSTPTRDGKSNGIVLFT
jgi:hypothetical protein